MIAVVVGVGGYFGFGWVKERQLDLNRKADQAARESDGGQLGHIAELNSVLDATDPNRFSRGADADFEEMAARQVAAAARLAAGTTVARTMPEKELPVIPASWTLEVENAKIPEGRANGSISGTNFVVDTASLTRGAQSYVLSLRQGAGVSPDREILVYLRPAAGAMLAGKTWTTSDDMRDAQVSQVIKRWKPDPRYAPRQRSFRSGYVMKLELGQVKDEMIPGKIFLAFPDEEHSVVAGLFSIFVPAPGVGAMDGDL